jgi:putative transposase
MRLARLKRPDQPVTHFHCISRIVNRDFRLQERERSVFVDWMRRYEIFCGVRVVAFCIMSNHFHILVEVPKRPQDKDLPTDAELVSRVKQCQGIKAADLLEWQLAQVQSSGAAAARKQGLSSMFEATVDGDDAAARCLRSYNEIREKWFARMWDVSTFMQGLKRRFSAWYNKENARVGTLWEERFKSMIVQGNHALAAVAAYIDLNPIRAKIVEDPADYRWSSYGEACHGVYHSRAALRWLVAKLRGPSHNLQDVMRWYRMYIYERGIERGVGPDGKPMKTGFTRDQVDKVRAQQGKLPAIDQLQRRVRHLSDGLVMGTSDFVEEVFREHRSHFGPKRKDGPRKMGQGETAVAWSDLRVMRDLRMRATDRVSSQSEVDPSATSDSLT